MTGIVIIVLDQVYDVRHGQHAGKLDLPLFHVGADTMPAMGLMDRKEGQDIDTDH